MTDLRDFFMKPKQMKNGLDIYPIGIMEYEEFKNLASKYIVLNILQLNNQRKQEKQPLLEQEHLFDYLVYLASINYETRQLVYKLTSNDLTPSEKLERDEILEKNPNVKAFINNKKELKALEETNYEKGICDLFEMSLHKKVVFNKTFGNFDVLDEKGKLAAILNKRNFDEFRDIVMQQNLLYEPTIAPTKIAQKYIDAKLNKPGNENDMEAIIAFVSTNTSNKDISEYSYYKLIAEFKSLIIQMNRNDVVRYSAGGATKKNGNPLDIPNILEKLNVNSNPYADVFDNTKGDEDIRK